MKEVKLILQFNIWYISLSLFWDNPEVITKKQEERKKKKDGFGGGGEGYSSVKEKNLGVHSLIVKTIGHNIIFWID